MKPSHRIFIIFLTDKALMFYSNNKAQIKIFWNLCGSCQKSSHAPVSGQRPDLGAIVWNSLCVYGLMFSFWEMKMEIRGLCNRFSQHLTQSSIWSRGIYIYQLTCWLLCTFLELFTWFFVILHFWQPEYQQQVSPASYAE